MASTTHNTKRIAVAAGVIAVLVLAYVLSQLVTASSQTERAGDLGDVPGGRAVDPNNQLDHGRAVTFHAWTDPDDGSRYILAHGQADPRTLEHLAGRPRYTARYGPAYDPGKTAQRLARWYDTHGVGPRGWPTRFDANGCDVFGRTAVGKPFSMAFDRRTGRFVLRYELP